MIDFVTLTCPGCGGKLKVSNDIDQFTCSYCGTECIVRREGGTVSLARLVEGLKNVQAGVDRTASELAIRRLRQDIEALEGQKRLVQSDNPSNFGEGCLTVVSIPVVLLGLGILIVSLIQGSADGAIAGIWWLVLGLFPFVLGFSLLKMKNSDIREHRKKQEQQLNELETKKNLLVEELHRQEAVVSPSISLIH